MKIKIKGYEKAKFDKYEWQRFLEIAEAFGWVPPQDIPLLNHNQVNELSKSTYKPVDVEVDSGDAFNLGAALLQACSAVINREYPDKGFHQLMLEEVSLPRLIKAADIARRGSFVIQ